jgi:hypothetical protein
MAESTNYEPPWTLVESKRKTRKTRQLAAKLAANKKYMNRVMKTVKFMNKRNAGKTSNLNVSAAASFMKEMSTIPVYIIRAHACIMSAKKAEKIKAKQIFEVPKDTYIVSFGSPGDYMCLSSNRLINLKARLADIRKYMYLHSPSDVRSKPVKFSTSLFSDMKRIAQYRTGNEKVMFPNINYTMNNIDRERLTREAETVNEYGVYRIDNTSIREIANFTNKDSIVKQNRDLDDWNLDDIIEEVYQKTGIRTGIFISLGCLSACGDHTGAPDFLFKMGAVYEEANALYNTVRPTMTKGEVVSRFGEEALAKDIPTRDRIAKMTPGLYERMVKEGLINPEEWPEALEDVAEEDWDTLYKLAGLI